MGYNVLGAPLVENSPMDIWKLASAIQKRHMNGELDASAVVSLVKNNSGPAGMFMCLKDPEMSEVLDRAADHPVFKLANKEFFTILGHGGASLTPVSDFVTLLV